MYLTTEFININFRDYNTDSLFKLCSEGLNDNSKKQWEKDIYTFIHEWLGEKDHIIVHTSGSTGTPKPIILKKKWMINSARQTCDFFKLDESSKALLCLPAAYIAGKMMIVRAIVSGMGLFAVEPTANPFGSLQQLVDFAAVTPFQLHHSLQTLKQNPIVNTLIVGGGEISPDLQVKVQDLPSKIYATYGMTETSSHIALRKVNGDNMEEYFSVLGKTEIQQDDRNCLTIKNPDLFDGTLITNDVVEIHDSTHFRWIGRFDNIINSGGIKIAPEEIEQSIALLRSERMVISSIKDSLLGEAIVLVIEATELSENEKEQLKETIKSLSTSSYLLPRQIFGICPFPETATGKIDRKQLKNKITDITPE